MSPILQPNHTSLTFGLPLGHLVVDGLELGLADLDQSRQIGHSHRGGNLELFEDGEGLGGMFDSFFGGRTGGGAVLLRGKVLLVLLALEAGDVPI